MTTVATEVQPIRSHQGWFARSEAWLDSKGKGAWIAAVVLGFIFFWPVGLALLAYTIWSKRMFGKCSKSRNLGRTSAHWNAMKPSGNRAFDAYKEETLRRLQDEQQNFEAFLERLRAAKDKAEFDEFMEDRSRDAARNRAERDDDDSREPRQNA